MTKILRQEILNLLENNQNELTLKEYLISLLSVVRENKDKEMNNKTFISMLEEAFKIRTTDINYNDKISPIFIDSYEDNYKVVEEVLLFQIIDFNGIEKSGKLINNELNYFGIDSPQGNRWYNFDINTYFECGSSWMIDFSESCYAIKTIDWLIFAEFLEMGRTYE